MRVNWFLMLACVLASLYAWQQDPNWADQNLVFSLNNLHARSHRHANVPAQVQLALPRATRTRSNHLLRPERSTRLRPINDTRLQSKRCIYRACHWFHGRSTIRYRMESSLEEEPSNQPRPLQHLPSNTSFARRTDRNPDALRRLLGELILQ